MKCHIDGCNNEIPPTRSAYCSAECAAAGQRLHARANVARERADLFVRPDTAKTPRTCLRCGRRFLSHAAPKYNRICPQCSEQEPGWSKRAQPAHLSRPLDNRDQLESPLAPTDSALSLTQPRRTL